MSVAKRMIEEELDRNMRQADREEGYTMKNAKPKPKPKPKPKGGNKGEGY